MKNEKKAVSFKMGYIVLKTLGKGLYSNPWSAISELVANGLDAGAREVNVIFNNKGNKIYDVYIIDNGSGMSESDLENYYIKVGHNKRKENPDYVNSEDVMGRKGIGKLAALYLTDRYELISKKRGYGIIHYEADFSEYSDEEEPSMSVISSDSYLNISEKYIEGSDSYTVVYMRDVHLRNYGDIAFDSLAIRLSNFFSYDVKNYSSKNIKPKLNLYEYKHGEKVKKFNIAKKIAFKNMLLINDINSNIDFSDIKGSMVSLGLKGKKKEVDRPIEIISEDSSRISGKIQNIDYQLTGWMGMHSTINTDEARKNDENYTKNIYYNPLQIRVYVRNKLAIENFQAYIGSTQTYGNYIEGELSFDILDHNELEDIATANRQDVDINDERVQKLIEIVKTIVQSMIKKRLGINDEVRKTLDDQEKKEEDIAKTHLKNSVESDLDRLNLGQETKEQVIDIMTNKVKGEFIKNNYSLFFSHARDASVFSDFIYEYLLALGAVKKEIFYTTAQTQGYDEKRQFNKMNKQIKENIRDNNSMIVYFSYPSFKISEYCMFEGGAGWASRSSESLHIITDKHEEIPSYLKIYDLYVTELTGKLNREIYFQITNSINIMVRHLNKGRKINNEELINEIPEKNIPSNFELSRKNERIENYFDFQFIELWNYFSEKVSKHAEIQRTVSEKYKDGIKEIKKVVGEESESNL